MQEPQDLQKLEQERERQHEEAQEHKADQQGLRSPSLFSSSKPFSRLLTVVAMSSLFAIFAFVLQLRLQHPGI